MASRTRNVRASTAASSAAAPVAVKKTVPKKTTAKSKASTSKKGSRAQDSMRVDNVVKDMDNVAKEVSGLKDMFQQFMAAQGALNNASVAPDQDALLRDEEEELEEWQDDEDELVVEAPLPPIVRPKKTVARPLGSRQQATAESTRRAAAARTARAVRHAPAEADEYSDDEEVSPSTSKGKRPRDVSGLLRTAATVKPKFMVQWPHEKALYKQGATPPAYQDLSLDQFVRGFIMTSLKAPQDELLHRLRYLSDLMADCRVRSWEKVRDFHAVWMQELEQGEATWDTSIELLGVFKLRHLYLDADTTRRAGGREPRQEGKGADKSTRRSKPTAGGKTPMVTCKAYNEGSCEHESSSKLTKNKSHLA